MVVKELVAKLGLNVDPTGFNKARQKFKEVGNQFGAIGRKMSFAISLPLATFSGFALKASSDVEQLNISFETMLGSAQASKKMIRDMFDFARKTPFEIQNIGPTIKSLLAVGITQEKIIPTLKSLGDVASGLSVPLQRLTLNFGQIRAIGHLTGREMRDFQKAGVPLLAELAKNLKVFEDEVPDMISRGLIKFEDVEKAFVTMSSEGGRFNNLMIKQSKTLGGRWSNLMDVFFLVRAEFGKVLEAGLGLKNLLKKLTDSADVFIKFLQSLTKTQKKLVAGFILALIVIPPLMIMFGVMTSLIFSLSGALMTATVSSIALSAGLALIPLAILAIIAGIALLVDDFIIWKRGGRSLIGLLIGGFKDIMEELQPLIDGLRGMWDGFKDIFKGMGLILAGIFQQDPEKVLRGWEMMFDGIVDLTKGFVKTMLSELNPLRPFYQLGQFLGTELFKLTHDFDRNAEIGLDIFRNIFGDERVDKRRVLSPLDLQQAFMGAQLTPATPTSTQFLGGTLSKSTLTTNNITVNIDANKTDILDPEDLAETITRHVRQGISGEGKNIANDNKINEREFVRIGG